MRISDSRIRNFIAIGILLFSGALTACSENTGPTEDFLIRTPTDNGASETVVSFFAWSTAPDTLHFEWEAAPGATEYSIVFWRSRTREEMLLMQADYSSPAFTIEVPSAEVVNVRYHPDREDDLRELAVVQHDVPLAEMAGYLASIGAVSLEPTYFTWTIYASNSKKTWRSSETHRMILTYVDF